jgi:hypothetical protein
MSGTGSHSQRISDSLFKQPIQTANSNQPIKPPMRHHPYCLARPRVGPSSHYLPSKMRGMARQGAQPLFFVCPHSLSEIRGAARRATQTSLRRLGLFAASSFLRRAALFVVAPNRDGLRQPAPGGRPLLAARRSPGAARVRALRGTPAGAAPCSTIRRLMMTPLDEQGDRTIFTIGLKSREPLLLRTTIATPGHCACNSGIRCRILGNKRCKRQFI